MPSTDAAKKSMSLTGPRTRKFDETMAIPAGAEVQAVAEARSTRRASTRSRCPKASKPTSPTVVMKAKARRACPAANRCRRAANARTVSLSSCIPKRNPTHPNPSAKNGKRCSSASLVTKPSTEGPSTNPITMKCVPVRKRSLGPGAMLAVEKETRAPTRAREIRMKIASRGSTSFTTPGVRPGPGWPGRRLCLSGA